VRPAVKRGLRLTGAELKRGSYECDVSSNAVAGRTEERVLKPDVCVDPTSNGISQQHPGRLAVPML
jgi:hypothetical protein